MAAGDYVASSPVLCDTSGAVVTAIGNLNIAQANVSGSQIFAVGMGNGQVMVFEVEREQ